MNIKFIKNKNEALYLVSEELAKAVKLIKNAKTKAELHKAEEAYNKAEITFDNFIKNINR